MSGGGKAAWRHTVNRDQIAGNWKQIAGTLREKWGELTEDDLATINGSREILAGKLQERYGIALEEAQAQARKFADQFTAPNEVATEGGPVTTETLKIGM
jgi:uncharacterized protein YjbJ (UPF0337 family)